MIEKNEKVVPVDFAKMGGLVEVGENYLKLSADFPSELIGQLYGQLRALAGGVAWIVGDFFCQIENLKGSEVAHRLMDEWDVSYGQAATWRRVCDAFEPAMRRAELSFSHHEQALVSTASIEEAIDLLGVAARNRLSCSDMRQHAAGQQKTIGRGPSKSGVREFYATLRVVERLKREPLDAGTRAQLKEDLKPLVEWYGTL